MKKRFFKSVSILTLLLFLGNPTLVRADFWGGDVIVLGQILANAIQQLVQLRSILSTGMDTYNYLQEINRGIQDALSIIRTQNTTLSPGILGQIDNLEQLMNAVERLYGMIPNTSEANMQRTMDQSVAEGINLHNEAFKYAQKIDPEGERIKDYSKTVSPLGAQRLTAESIGVMIHILNQILRTDAAILKIQSESLGLSNKQQKINSSHFKMEYEGISRGFKELKPTYDLPSLGGSAH